MTEPQENESLNGGQAVPQTRTARHRRIVDILNRQAVRSQSQLAKLLADDGLSVTQATLSRDLDELGAVKIRNTGGELIYAVPSEGGDRKPRAPLGESAKEERMAPALRRAAHLGRGVGQSRRPAHAAGGRTVPGLGHRPGRTARHPRHHRGRRHADAHQPGPRGRPGARGSSAATGAEGALGEPAERRTSTVRRPPGGCTSPRTHGKSPLTRRIISLSAGFRTVGTTGFEPATP